MIDISDFLDTPHSDYDSERRKFIEHMDFLKSMTNEEHTLYKKWIEVQEYAKLLDKSSVVKTNIWYPRDITNKDMTIEDINAISPEIVFVRPTDKKLLEEWLILRVFIHTMEFEQNPGRFARFLIRDKMTGKYLGVASIGSDVISITCRDKWIGWDEETRVAKGKIRHSAIATTIVPIQPLGFNMLGGKLIASMMCLKPVQDAWRELYEEALVGLTTTSLYGIHSMYQRIPFWHELGETTGRIMMKPTDTYYDFWHHWLQANRSEKYKMKTDGTNKESGPATGVKQKILVMIMQELNMKQTAYMHGFQRGVYYSQFYENTREFLRGEIEESQLIPSKKLTNGIDGVMKWWLPKAVHRYEKLLSEDRIEKDILYYNRMIGMSWDEAKSTYLKDVGR